jgi:hypothetical protein
MIARKTAVAYSINFGPIKGFPEGGSAVRVSRDAALVDACFMVSKGISVTSITSTTGETISAAEILDYCRSHGMLGDALECV